MKDFTQLELPAQIHQAIQKLGFTTPTPIQVQAIPVALEGRDIIGNAQTGTGKTAAFAIPLLAKLANEHGKDAVILVPTRELAQQITDVLRKLTEGLPRLRPAIIIGGASMRIQQQVLRRHPRIIVATPGRLIDHLGSKTVVLDRVGYLVLDEADQMLDMGFAPQLNQILRYLPKERQTLFFSATMPAKIMELATRFLNNPVRISAGENSRPVEAIKQTAVRTTAAKKNDLILDELNARKGSTLIFVRTKSRTEKLHQYLQDYGYSVARIHGGRSQAQRTHSLNEFRSGTVRILVATDIAARGLDIPHIEHVINFDLPMAPEDYVHRIGRTARAGRIGEALAILLPEDEDQWRRIQRLVDPNAKREKTFSRPPVGGNYRRHDDRSSDRGARGPKRFDRTEGRSQRPSFRKDGAARPMGSSRPIGSSRSLGSSRPTPSGQARMQSKPSGSTDSRASARYDRSTYPQRPFTDKELQQQDRGFDRPKKSFDRADRNTDRPKRAFKKSEGGFDRPAQRSFDRPQRSDDRPKRSFDRTEGGQDRPKRPFQRSEGSFARKTFGGSGSRDQRSGDQRSGDQRRAGPRPGARKSESRPAFSR